MSITHAQPTPHTKKRRGLKPGPAFLCVGSLHGNEPAGTLAIQRVLERIDRDGPLDRGDLFTLIGNPEAIALKQRYVDRDLNRLWNDRRVARLRHHGPNTVEGGLTLAIADLIDEVTLEARGDRYLLDLHTTSGDSPPFSNAVDRLESRRIALRLQAPTVLGIEEQLDGTLVDWLDRRGFVGTVFESGQHDDPGSVDRAEAAIWLSLEALGMIEPSSPLAPAVQGALGLLTRAAQGLPRMVELIYRHALDDRTAFDMLPGFSSFQAVSEGQLLAHEMENPVHSPADGRLLMPLYQPQGDEGFFLVRDYGAAQRLASQILRRAGFIQLATALPGVSRARGRPGVLVLEPSARRGDVRNFLRLLGFRRERVERGAILLSR